MIKKSSRISMVVIGTLIGLLATLHLKTPFQMESSFPIDEVEAKNKLFKEFLDEQIYLQSKIVTLRKQIDEAQFEIVSTTESSNLSKLESLKNIIGLSEVSGRGVEIHLDDSPFALRESENPSEEALVQASDIRDVVNLLRANDSVGISVNGQRVIHSSPITSVGSTILINNSHVYPPFTINAVGNVDNLGPQLMNRNNLNALYDKIDASKLKFDIYVRNNVLIPMYNADLKTDYLNTIK